MKLQLPDDVRDRVLYSERAFLVLVAKHYGKTPEAVSLAYDPDDNVVEFTGIPIAPDTGEVIASIARTFSQSDLDPVWKKKLKDKTKPLSDKERHDLEHEAIRSAIERGII